MAEKISSINFVDHYHSSYPPLTILRPEHVGETVHATSTTDFRNSRKDLMERLVVHGKPKHEVFSQSLLAEQVVSLALNPLLESSGFSAHLAPQSLEHGNGQKGVDLIITDPRKVAYLGIDIKLRESTNRKNRDGHGWNANVKAPFIMLSLGNWRANMDEENIPVSGWLKNYTVPNIKVSGQIPKLEEFRNYLAQRIERNIHGYWEELTEPEIFPGNWGIPQSREERTILQQKLATMHSLFTELSNV